MNARAVTTLLALLVLNPLYGQTEITIIKVKQKYAVIDKGTTHGINTGDLFRLYTPGDPEDFGDVEVIKASQTVSAVKLMRGTPHYQLKIGDTDRIKNQDESIADDLLSDFEQSRQAETYDRPDNINRKGFIIGFGIGFVGQQIRANAGFVSGEITRSAFLTDFKIGHAPSNTFEIYYINKVFWWGESNVTLAQGVSGLGFTVYTNKQTETGFFLTGGGGVSVIDAI